MKDRKPIVAQSTPQGIGAIALIRISGEDAFSVFLKLVKQTERFKNAPSRQIVLYTLMNKEKNQVIDEVTAIKYTSPRSFTGENMVEILCHGGKVITREIIDTLIRNGAQQAGRGAFTRRALENGKIDLMRAEGIQGMIESISEPNVVCAQKMYDGKINALLSIKEKLISIQSDMEAEIEFGEDEYISETGETGRGKIQRIIIDMEKEIELREKITNLDSGLKIVISGPTNAGKSTLFNRLLGYQRVLVHHEPGTTRDMICESVLINGHEIKLIDCAGLRDTSNNIEKEGISITKSAINAAQLIIWVTAANEALSENERQVFQSYIKGKRVLGVINKIDTEDGALKKAFFTAEGICHCSISLILGKNVDRLMTMVKEEIDSIFSSIELPEILFNKRHEELGRKIVKHLKKAEQVWTQTEIAAYHMKNAQSDLEEIFGAFNNEEIFNNIFNNFCIGK